MKEANLPLYTRRDKAGNARQFSIVDFAIYQGLLPTPTTQETPHYEAELTETNRRKAANGNSHSMNVADMAMRGLLPTPTAMDSTGATANMKSNQVKDGSMHSSNIEPVCEHAANACNQDYKGARSTEALQESGRTRNEQPAGLFQSDWEEFPTQSPLCGRNDGLSGKLDNITFPKWRAESIKAYGNAIVPQVAFEIFKAIESKEKTLSHHLPLKHRTC
jgi:hypothetical protein